MEAGPTPRFPFRPRHSQAACRNKGAGGNGIVTMTVDAAEEAATGSSDGGLGEGTLVRLFGWAMLAFMTGFLINNYLTYWIGLPGVQPLWGGSANGEAWLVGSLLQAGLYAVLTGFAAAMVLRTARTRTLRQDSRTISDINQFLIRAAFYSVLLVGFADLAISFLRVEGFIEAYLGKEMAAAFARPSWRGPYIHMPLIALSVLVAAMTRGLGFIWLALLVVVAEFLIVIGRFIFSYEQPFMADLVRFWYAALFLFASAYTLLEEGHVRVDVFYAGMRPKTKGWVNFTGTLFMGIPLCWVILWFGMLSQRAVINSPLINYEITQQGFGLYVKYLTAVFLGVYAVSMLVQFVSYLLDAFADIRGHPGGRDHEVHAVQ